MKRKTKKVVIAISVFVALAIFLAIAGLNKNLSVSGFQTLSLGQVNFNSNDPSIGGQAWLLTVSQNGAGQSASGSFTAQDSLGDTSNPFTITTSLDKNYASYNIQNQNRMIKRINWEKTKFNPLGASFSNGQQGFGCNTQVWNNAIRYGIVPGYSNVYCYNLVNVGSYGTVSSANINFQSTIAVQGSGGSDSCIITNSGSQSCISNNGNILASWAGSLVSGQSAPQPTDQDIIALYDTNQGGWKTGNLGSYNNWDIYDRIGFGSCLNPMGIQLSTYNADSCFNNYNNLESSLMAGYSFTSVGGNIATTTGGQNNGQVIMNLPSQLQFPVITMKVKANLIGINIPVGKPKIISASSNLFQTGQTGIITVTVQNIGNSAGSFNVFASCNNGFSQIGNALTISALPINSQQIVYLPISSNIVSGTSQGTCTITVKDINNPNNMDTYSVGVSSNAISICTNGETSISGNLIQQCQSNRWVTTTSCASNETAKYVNGVPQCVSNTRISGNWFSNIFNSISKFFFDVGNVLTLIKLVAVLAIFIFSMLFSKDLFSGFRALRKKEWITWIFAIIIAVGIAAISFLIFWLSVVLFIGITLIKFLLRR